MPICRSPCVILGVEDLRIEQREVPTIGTHDVLVRVRAGGIRGSDLHYYLEGRNGDRDPRAVRPGP